MTAQLESDNGKKRKAFPLDKIKSNFSLLTFELRFNPNHS